MSRREEVYVPALSGKKIPLLTLDHKWHQLFSQVHTNASIKKAEEELNTLLKQQGKINTETKDIKKIKNRLMDEIVNMMEDSANPETAKKIEDNKRLIEECNQKLDTYRDENMELPKMINDANKKLMLLTMEACYEDIQDNTKQLKEITEWIDNIRVELKKNMIRKEEMQRRNQDLYAYMHDIFGADVIEIFDMKFGVDSSKDKK